MVQSMWELDGSPPYIDLMKVPVPAVSNAAAGESRVNATLDGDICMTIEALPPSTRVFPTIYGARGEVGPSMLLQLGNHRWSYKFGPLGVVSYEKALNLEPPPPTSLAQRGKSSE